MRRMSSLFYFPPFASVRLKRDGKTCLALIFRAMSHRILGITNDESPPTLLKDDSLSKYSDESAIIFSSLNARAIHQCYV